jgi:hypothetical protein
LHLWPVSAGRRSSASTPSCSVAEPHRELLGWIATAGIQRSSSPAAWGGLLRSPRPDWMGVGHLLDASLLWRLPSPVLPQVARPRWWCGGRSVQFLRRRRGGRQERPDRVLRFFQGPFYNYSGLECTFPFVEGPPCNCVDDELMKLSPGPSRPVYRSKKKQGPA